MRGDDAAANVGLVIEMPPTTSDTAAVHSTQLWATADGRIALELSGPRSGPARAATLTLTSAHRISPRWLGSGRPRIVTFGSAHVVLPPRTTTTVTLRLAKDRLALLRRMGTIRATARVTTQANNGHVVAVSRRLNLHAPRRA